MSFEAMMASYENEMKWNDRIDKAKAAACAELSAHDADHARAIMAALDMLKAPGLAPTPEEIEQNEKPEFEPDQWVMILCGDIPDRGPYQLESLAETGSKGSEHEGEIFWVTTCHHRYVEEILRHATDAEKFRPGAVVRYEYKGLIVQNEVKDFWGGAVVFVQFPRNSFPGNCCTLITAAPEKSVL